MDMGLCFRLEWCVCAPLEIISIDGGQVKRGMNISGMKRTDVVDVVVSLSSLLSRS